MVELRRLRNDSPSPLRSSSRLQTDRVPSTGLGSPPITLGRKDRAGRRTAARCISSHDGLPRTSTCGAVRFDPERGTPIGEPYALTQFDSPSLVISPDIARSEMDVSSRHAVLTMKTVRGSIWMLDNVDRGGPYPLLVGAGPQ